jgi:hypothetical protein
MRHYNVIQYLSIFWPSTCTFNMQFALMSSAFFLQMSSQPSSQSTRTKLSTMRIVRWQLNSPLWFLISTIRRVVVMKGNDHFLYGDRSCFWWIPGIVTELVAATQIIGENRKGNQKECLAGQVNQYSVLCGALSVVKLKSITRNQWT